MNVCLKDCFLSVNFFCSSKKICSEGVTCPCVTVSRDFKMVIELMNLEVELSLSLHFFFISCLRYMHVFYRKVAFCINQVEEIIKYPVGKNKSREFLTCYNVQKFLISR